MTTTPPAPARTNSGPKLGLAMLVVATRPAHARARAGGRLGDLAGRRRVLRIGAAAFTVASLVRGLAPNGGLLIAARAVQGAGAALAAPNALALMGTTFPAAEARNKAVGLYGAMARIGISWGYFSAAC